MSQPPPDPSPAAPAVAPQRDNATRRLIPIVRAYIVLPHTVPVLVVLGTTAGFALLATEGVPGIGELSRLLLAMLGGQIAIGAVNEVVDAELDAVVKPSKPIPAGYVSVRTALILAGLSLLGMLWFSASFGLASLVLCSLGTGTGLAYNLWFKRTLFSWLPYLVALPLLPIWVWTAMNSFDARLLLLYPLGMFAVVGVHLSQSLPDTESDRTMHVHNVSSVLGERHAILACWAATLSAPALAIASAPQFAEQPRWVWLAAVLVVSLVATNAILYAENRRLGVMACFPLVAVSTAVMGLGWVLAVR